MNFLSLFSGGGCGDLGLERHGRNSDSQFIASACKCYEEHKLPPSKNRQYTLITETNSNRKRKTSRTTCGLDTPRGVVIGNGITVPVIEWIGKRIRAVKEAEKYALLEQK